jgi:type II secretory pathway predicted ATPase ExeA
MVLGNSGMGKTSLFDDLQASLDHHRHHIVYLSSSLVSAVGIVHALAQHLHVTPRRFYLETVHIIGDAIAAQSSHLLLWIDEADRVDGHTLQELRMVAESRPQSDQLFSLVLSGLPLLGAKLDAPDLFPLKRRIVLRWTLAGLRREELADFLYHRFGAEDAARLPDEVHDELFERTQACPALIDSIVRCALSQTPSQTPINPEVFRAILNIAPF